MEKKTKITTEFCLPVDWKQTGLSNNHFLSLALLLYFLLTFLLESKASNRTQG